MEHSEATIIKELRRYFQNGYTYRIDNAFIFSYDWESDFFCVNREGYAFEFEVKVTKADFYADFKKQKHQIFVKGTYTTWQEINGIRQYKEVEKKYIPNRFYYTCPAGLISLNEIPEYAGLITVGIRGVVIEKRAPFIHRTKIDFRKKLCDKFYHRWLEEKRKFNLLQDSIQRKKNYQDLMSKVR